MRNMTFQAPTLIIVFFIIVTLGGCDFKIKDALFGNHSDEKTFTAKAYNYTPHDLYSIVFKEVSLPLKIDEAPGADSVFNLNSGREQLDDGSEVKVGGESCCLIWNTPVDKPLRIRVVWSVIFDLRAFNAKPDNGYDREKSRHSAPGSSWCEAVIDVPPAIPGEKPDRAYFHFLPDGTVQARLGEFKNAMPLPSTEVKKHATPLPPGQFCKQEIENPYFGIPRKPHRE